MSTVKNYLSLIKFSHTIFAMPFAMIGFFLALSHNPVFSFNYMTSSQPGWHITIGLNDYNSMPLTMTAIVIRFFLVILCMIFARSAAMAFNRYLDRKFDAK